MESATSTSDGAGMETGAAIADAVRNGELTREGIVRLLEIADPEELQKLFIAADAIRQRFVGSEVFLRGIVEFSNFCRRDCLYCGLRLSNRDLPRYRMEEGEILAAAHRIKAAGISTIVLQSGEDPCQSTVRICRLIRRIKDETSLVVTLSVGERPLGDYLAFREAGANRYLLKQETSSPELYARFRPGCRHEERQQCLRHLKELGYEIGTGNIVGLPGQNTADLAAVLLFIREIDADMVGIGPFIAHPQTPLAPCPNGSPAMTLKVLAVARLLTRSTNIPATTALATIAPQGWRDALQSGANVIMPNFTPVVYRGLYEIYPGKSSASTNVPDFPEMLEQELRDSGRIIGTGSGFRKRQEISG